MSGATAFRDLGLLADVALHVDLKNTAGVYLMSCSACAKAAYVGKSKEILVRLINHAYVPPYGAVDLIIGEVIRTDKRERWEQLCSHLKAAAAKTRVDVARSLRVEVRIPDDPADVDRIETEVLSRNPGVFGDGQRVWGSTHSDDFTQYRVQRAGGNLPRSSS